MPTIERLEPITWYSPITRRDDDEQIVEGYCFVNEFVRGEGGVRLRRAAMEAATSDYMKFAPLREMHQPLAAGKILSMTWDEHGCYVRAKVVDPVAWLKVKEGVYQGFSVGVNPRVRRGLDIEAVDWIENSLVDSPKDRDAIFSMFRAAGRDVLEVECLVLKDDELLPVAIGESMRYTVTAQGDQFLLRAANGDEWGTFDSQEEAEKRGATIIERQDAGTDPIPPTGPDAGPNDQGATDPGAGAGDPGRIDPAATGADAGDTGSGAGDPSGDAGTGAAGGDPTADTTRSDNPEGADVQAADGAGGGAGSGDALPEPGAQGSDDPGAGADATPPAEPQGAPQGAPVGRAAGKLDEGADNDDADVARNLTSDVAPARENLEGKCPVCGTNCTRCMSTRTDAAGDPRDEDDSLLRMTRLETENAELLTRAETAETDLATVRADLTAATARVTELENEPAPTQLPMRFFEGVPKDFLVNRANELTVEKDELQKELDAEMKSPLARTATPEEQNAKAARINVLRQQLNRL